MTRPLRVAALALGVLLLAAPGARAQTLRGHVMDRATRQPVSGATVILLGPDEAQVAASISDDAGAFSVSAAAGEYRVTVQRLGYASTVDGPIRLRVSGFAEVTLQIQPQAIALDSVAVSVDQRDPALLRSGFYARQKEGSGQFLDREFIENRNSNRMADILSGLKGLRLISDNNTTDVQIRNAMTGTFSGNPRICLPLIFVDGLLMADGKVPGFGRMDLEQIRPNDLSGIEVYSGESSVPMQFARGGGACGAIVYWTRSGPPLRKK